MASITKRIFTLVISESLNYAVIFLSPIFLVRILDVKTFGEYREFMVYSSLILAFTSFGIKSNLLYFISKDPKNKSIFVTNTVYLLLIFSIVGIIIVFFLQSYIRSLLSYDFVYLLLIFIFCFQNVDLLDNYFLSIKRSDYVLFWSSGNAIIRTSSLIVVAYLTRDIWSIIHLLIILEIIKTCFTLFVVFKDKVFNWKINFLHLKEQLRYILPLGFSSVINRINVDISKIVISTNLGPAALAIYSIGSQNLPFFNIVRNSVSNVIFPEMAMKTNKSPRDALKLWQKNNVMYFFLMSPLFLIFMFYADTMIQVLFTSKYDAAIPLFRIYLILLIRKCFEMSMPIRAMNKNKFFVAANVLYLVSNIILIYILYNLIGFLGPAIAAVISEIIQSIYLANKVMSVYEVKLVHLLAWNKLIRIATISLSGLPILSIIIIFFHGNIFLIVLSSLTYLMIYIYLFKKFRLEEVDLFMNKLLSKLKISW